MGSIQGGSTSRRGLLQAGRALAVVLTIAVLATLGTRFVVLQRANSAIPAIAVGDALFTDDPNLRPTTTDPGANPGASSDASTSPDTQGSGATRTAGTSVSVSPQDAAAKPAENILLLGLDTRGDATGGVGPGTSQSDVIMLIHLFAGHRQIRVLMIPRDTYVKAPSCLQWDNVTGKVSGTPFSSQYTSWKVTNAYSVGGPQCSVKAVQELTGLRVDRLVAIQFNGFKAIVDQLGGVEIKFASPVIDRHQGTVMAKAGTQNIDGDLALRLVRSRTVKGDSSGDLGRMDRQRLVIRAMLKKMSDNGLLSDSGRLDAVMKTFADNSTTANLDVDQLLSLAGSMSNGAKVDFVALPTAQDPTAEGRVMVADKAEPLLNALAQDRAPA